MTTFAQIDKFAGKWFADQMRRRGFAVEKKFVFWRKRGPLYDMFLPQLLKGDLLRINVTIWSPWADNENGELGVFPPSSCLIGGDLSSDFPELMHSGELFSVDSENSADKSFKKMLTLIDKKAVPWFSTVTSYEEYTRYIGAHGFHPTEEYQAALRKGIARGFVNEPF